MPIVNIILRETKAIRNIIEGPIKADNRTFDVKLDDVREFNTGTSENNAVIFDFVFTSNYALKEPKNKKLGEIEIKGEILYFDVKESIKKILDNWKKGRKIEPELMGPLLNAALNKSQIEAIEQSTKVGLPLPIPLPSLKQEKTASKTSAS